MAFDDTIVITGAKGFIGKHLVKYFRDKGQKVCEVRSSSDRWPRDFDTVYALAGRNGTHHFYNEPATTCYANVSAIVTALEKAEHNDAKLVFTSSAEVYAGSYELGIASIPTSEEVPLCISDIRNPRWSYAAAKIAAEALVLGYVHEFGGKFNVARLHGIYGPGDPNDHVIPSIMKQVSTGKIKLMGYSNKRTFLHVYDCCSALEAIINNADTYGQIFNVGSDEEYSILSLTRKICDIARQSSIISLEDAPEGSPPRRLPDLTKLKALGWEPKYSLQEGLLDVWSKYEI